MRIQLYCPFCDKTVWANIAMIGTYIAGVCDECYFIIYFKPSSKGLPKNERR